MTCKHGIEQPTPQDIQRHEEQERKLREFGIRRSGAFLRRLCKLWEKAHPCYTCYTEP
jgi:hypothetical protein